MQSSFQLPYFRVEKVATLFDRGWWAGSWVVQELVLVSRVMSVCSIETILDVDEGTSTFFGRSSSGILATNDPLDKIYGILN
jgi:hypothetical protein